MRLKDKLKLKLNALKYQGVPFTKFSAFKDSLPDKPTDPETVAQIVLHFYPQDKRPLHVCLTEFENKVTIKVKFYLPKDLNFENNTAGYLIKADLLFTRGAYVELYNHLFNKKAKDIPVQLAEQVAQLFFSSTSGFKEKYQWIFEPPVTGQAGKATIGSEYRREFTEKYGGFMEIIYLISMGDPLKNEQIEAMRCENFLSLGEYLNHKKIVEAIE